VTTNQQLALLRLWLGEPSDSAQARFSPTQLVLALNEGRRWFCEKSKSFHIKDSQQTNPSNVATNIYSIPNDVMGFWLVEWDGIPLDPVETVDWRSRIGDRDDIQGIPEVYQYFARQLQLFPVPSDQKTLKYHGWGYAAELIDGGNDLDLTDQQARGPIWYTTWLLKGADERDDRGELAKALEISQEFMRQSKPKGPRYVREPKQVSL